MKNPIESCADLIYEVKLQHSLYQLFKSLFIFALIHSGYVMLSVFRNHFLDKY